MYRLVFLIYLQPIYTSFQEIGKQCSIITRNHQKKRSFVIFLHLREFKLHAIYCCIAQFLCILNPKSVGCFFAAWLPRTPEVCLCAEWVCVPGAASLALAGGYKASLGGVSTVEPSSLGCSGAGMLFCDPQFPG